MSTKQRIRVTKPNTSPMSKRITRLSSESMTKETRRVNELTKEVLKIIANR